MDAIGVEARFPLQVTVSGSFKRHLVAVQDAVATLLESGAVILSPSDPRVVDAFGDFVFVHSDRRRSIKGVQSRHLEAIRKSDFLWLVCPDGYVGQSAAMELGFAVSANVPVYSDVAPSDWTLRQYVTPVVSVANALVAAWRNRQDIGDAVEPGLLVAPEAALANVRRDLDFIEWHLLRGRTHQSEDPLDQAVRRIRRTVKVPATK